MMDFKEFQADDKTSSAVIRKLEIIEEAAKYVPDGIRCNYPDVPRKPVKHKRGDDNLLKLSELTEQKNKGKP